MGVHHLISINEDQLRNWQGDPDELLSKIGSAVVLACLDRTTASVTISDDTSNALRGQSGDAITVVHIHQHESQEFAVWAWASEEEVCLADLSRDDLMQLDKLISDVLHGQVIDRS